MKYVDSGGHTRIRLRTGSGTDNQTLWFVNCERLVRWRGIAAAAPAGSAEKTRADAEVRAIEADMLIPALTP